MKLAVIATSLTVLMSASTLWMGPVVAAEGDRWSTSRQNVNVRTGPSTNAEVLLSINAGEEIVEIAAKGEWVYVDFPRLNQRGWIYSPLLEAPGSVPAQPAPAETTTTAEAAPSALEPSQAASEPAAGNIPVATDPASIEAPQATTPQQPIIKDGPTQLTEVTPGDEPAAVKSFRETVIELNERAVSVAGINLFTDVRSTGGGGVQVLATDTWTNVPEAGRSSYMNALFERWQAMANGLGPLTLQILDPTGNVVMERSDS